MNRVLSFVFALVVASSLASLGFASELEDAFFELLWRCDSPWLSERDYAEDELAKKFVEFEPIWKNREFLTDGEISAEARQRFELAEARWRRASAQKSFDSFRIEWNVEEPTTDEEGKGTRLCVVRVEWNATSRIVYFVPKFESLFWRDKTDGTVWRPVARFSSPELLPEFDATSLEIETTLERVEGDDAENGEITRSLTFEALVGVDARELEIDVEALQERTISAGGLTVKGALGTRTEKDETLVAFRIDYDDPFDAFDSHRVWFEKSDFALKFEDEKRTPKRMKTRERSAAGTEIALYFDSSDELDAATLSGQARVAARLPRFFAFFEKTFDERD